MGCSSCSTGKDGKPGGCKSNGSCSTGGCNRLNTFDWLSKLDIHDVDNFNIVEVSFSQGSRKNFYHNSPQSHIHTGDTVVVETDSGYDIGHISLSGELVRMQMRKKRVDKRNVLKKVIRRANERDLERLNEARSSEYATMVRARAIARTLDLEMKIGDVEYQADRRKATFYYTADGRVDFRELIRHYAKEFRVKIEMRQIGARQESARIGGIGSCGRELCCSTWLTDFKTVSTTAARYQNLAINQAKLSGQCGRLKCCLNYELDSYIEAIEEFPTKADRLYTEAGMATLVKTDIFRRTMYYCYIQENGIRGKFYPLDLSRVREILAMNKAGEKPVELVDMTSLMAEEIAEVDFESVNDVIELPPEERRKRRKKSRNRNRNRKSPNKDASKTGNPKSKKEDSDKPIDKNRPPRNKVSNKPPRRTSGAKKQEKKTTEGQSNSVKTESNSSNNNNRSRPKNKNRRRPKNRNRSPRPNKTQDKE